MLCKILSDSSEEPDVIEPTLRAITFYLDVSADCIRRVVAVEGTLDAICGHLDRANLSNQSSMDIATQCIKVRIQW